MPQGGSYLHHPQQFTHLKDGHGGVSRNSKAYLKTLVPFMSPTAPTTRKKHALLLNRLAGSVPVPEKFKKMSPQEIAPQAKKEYFAKKFKVEKLATFDKKLLKRSGK